MSNRPAEDHRGEGATGAAAVQLGFKEFLLSAEGLLVPDKPSVPGMSKINMSLYPRSRLRVNRHLRARRPGKARTFSWPWA